MTVEVHRQRDRRVPHQRLDNLRMDTGIKKQTAARVPQGVKVGHAARAVAVAVRRSKKPDESTYLSCAISRSGLPAVAGNHKTCHFTLPFSSSRARPGLSLVTASMARAAPVWRHQRTRRSWRTICRRWAPCISRPSASSILRIRPPL